MTERSINIFRTTIHAINSSRDIRIARDTKLYQVRFNDCLIEVTLKLSIPYLSQLILFQLLRTTAS